MYTYICIHMKMYMNMYSYCWGYAKTGLDSGFGIVTIYRSPSKSYEQQSILRMVGPHLAFYLGIRSWPLLNSLDMDPYPFGFPKALHPKLMKDLGSASSAGA